MDGVLGRGQRATPSPQLRGMGSAVSSSSGVRGGTPENLDLGPHKSRQNGHLAFESGATSESGLGDVPPFPNVEPPLRLIHTTWSI